MEGGTIVVGVCGVVLISGDGVVVVGVSGVFIVFRSGFVRILGRTFMLYPNTGFAMYTES